MACMHTNLSREEIKYRSVGMFEARWKGARISENSNVLKSSVCFCLRISLEKEKLRAKIILRFPQFPQCSDHQVVRLHKTLCASKCQFWQYEIDFMRKDVQLIKLSFFLFSFLDNHQYDPGAILLAIVRSLFRPSQSNEISSLKNLFFRLNRR